MGRTRRHRQRKSKSACKSFSLDHDEKIIALKKWLCRMGWENHSKLRLTNFSVEGRGLSSTINIHPDDKIITIPFEAMITFVTLEHSYETMQFLRCYPETFEVAEIFAIFLAIEIHKNTKSKWKPYIDTLPKTPPVAWLLTTEEHAEIPTDIRDGVRKSRSRAKSFVHKLQRALSKTPLFDCSCCQKPIARIIPSNCYLDALILVHTRSVHLNYNLLRTFSDLKMVKYLKGKPTLALCPFLDLFNHCHNFPAETEFKQDGDFFTFSIVTKCHFKKNQQIFFPYGRHDNLSLLEYYGFYLKHNELDFVNFDFDYLSEKHTIPHQNFICSRRLHEGLHLYPNPSGATFNLKAVLYMIVRGENDFATKIFSESYSDKDLEEMNTLLDELLRIKLNNFIDSLETFNKLEIRSENLELVMSFSKDRIVFMLELLKEIDPESVERFCLDEKYKRYCEDVLQQS